MLAVTYSYNVCLGLHKLHCHKKNLNANVESIIIIATECSTKKGLITVPIECEVCLFVVATLCVIRVATTKTKFKFMQKLQL